MSKTLRRATITLASILTLIGAAKGADLENRITQVTQPTATEILAGVYDDPIPDNARTLPKNDFSHLDTHPVVDSVRVYLYNMFNRITLGNGELTYTDGSTTIYLYPQGYTTQEIGLPLVWPLVMLQPDTDSWGQDTLNIIHSYGHEVLYVNTGINLSAPDEIAAEAQRIENEFTGVYTPPQPTPTNYTISVGQNYPNPFNPITTIPINTPHDDAMLQVYNPLGQIITSRPVLPGESKITFDGSTLGDGTYFYNVSNNKETSPTKKMILLK